MNYSTKQQAIKNVNCSLNNITLAFDDKCVNSLCFIWPSKFFAIYNSVDYVKWSIFNYIKELFSSNDKNCQIMWSN
jgi:hypothetical protein